MFYPNFRFGKDCLAAEQRSAVHASRLATTAYFTASTTGTHPAANRMALINPINFINPHQPKKF
jgi:hypothetical protein